MLKITKIYLLFIFIKNYIKMSEENDSLENATNLSLDTSIKYDGDALTNISDDMEKSYLEYSMAVIVSRALPDVRD
jgi:hypothetical protein